MSFIVILFLQANAQQKICRLLPFLIGLPAGLMKNVPIGHAKKRKNGYALKDPVQDQKQNSACRKKEAVHAMIGHQFEAPPADCWFTT